MSRSRRQASVSHRLVWPASIAAAALMVMPSIGFACSQVMGALTLTPSSGHAGSSILSSVTGLKPYPARYDVFFGGACMTFSGKLLKVITPDSNGAWTNVKLTIPRNATLGSHSLCGVEAYPVAGQTATTHNNFTVV